MSHEEPSSPGMEFSLETEPDHEPILMGDVSTPGASASLARNSGGGLWAVLGLLFPVVLGGVTVFGVYFLFLDDLLNKPQPALPGQPAEPADEQPAAGRDSINEPPPTFEESSPKVSNSRPDSLPPLAEPPAETPADREIAAKNTLRLARQLSGKNPSAAVKWFRKVVEEYPNTEAAHEAQDWLKNQADEP